MTWGSQLEFSDDLGGSWTPATPFHGRQLPYRQPYLAHRTCSGQPGAGYAGVEPAALFRSNDYGVSWNEVTGLSKPPIRPEWQPGFGGLCFHSIVTDPFQHRAGLGGRFGLGRLGHR